MKGEKTLFPFSIHSILLQHPCSLADNQNHEAIRLAQLQILMCYEDESITQAQAKLPCFRVSVFVRGGNDCIRKK